ncbi:MAG: nucleoside-diphosphate sugar epimerase/dehydratase [Bacteroidota bacterium]
MFKDAIEKITEITKLVLNNSSSKFSVENLGYLPRWLVLWFDMQIVFFALVLCGFVTTDFTFNFFNYSFLPKLIIALFLTTFFFLIFKTYVGLIRHSSYIDAVKLLLASLFSSLALFFVNTVIYKVYDYRIYEPIFLIVFLLSLFVGLFLYRIIIKQAYAKFLAQSSAIIEKVFILGTSQNAISTAVAIENEYPKRFKVVGFIDNDIKNENKRVFSIPILHLSRKINTIIRAHKGNALIISENDLKSEENILLIEDCIANDIKIYRAPSISEFDLNKGINNDIQNIQIEDLLERKPISINNNKILKLVADKTVVVTGGAGSIGSEIVHQLANYKPQILIVIDQAETPLHHLTLKVRRNYPELNFIPIVCDVRNRQKIDFLLYKYKPHIIYHCAAYKHVPMMEINPSEAVTVNVLGSKNLVDLAAKHNIEKFIMISTDKAVNPTNVMGATKRAAEMYVQALHHHLSTNINFNTKYIITRFGNVLGSSGSVVPLFKKQISEGGPVTVTHPDIIRYFMTIPEACQLVMEASSMGKGGEIFLFDMGKAVKIIDLAEKMIRIAGYQPYKDIKIKTIGLRPGEKLYEELLNEQSITLPTYHDKIMIVKEKKDKYRHVNTKVNEIVTMANKFKTKDIVKKLKELVLEYKSLNSSFEELDQKIDS